MISHDCFTFSVIIMMLLRMICLFQSPMGPGLTGLVLISRRGAGRSQPAYLGSLLPECIFGSSAKLMGLSSTHPRKCSLSLPRGCHTAASELTASTPPHLYSFHSEFPEEDQLSFLQSFLVLEDVVTEDEEVAFMKEMEPHLKRHIYEKVKRETESTTQFS